MLATAGIDGDQKRIVIVGAGPTGLAAGYRLRELGYSNFVIVEARDRVGGLASSETTSNGFTYDIGGHVLFSHYEYFDRLFDKLLGIEYQRLQREAWVWMFDRFLPYPFQNNIKYLPRQVVLECLLGLIEAQKKPLEMSRFSNFEEFIHGVFGKGIAKHFMMPYNFKVWAHPPRLMNKEWVGQRVSVVDIERVLGNVILDRDDAGWGPNSTFKYPRHGGTGGIFERMRPFVEDNLRLNCPLVAVDSVKQEVCLANGTREKYDLLFSTIPMDQLVCGMNGEVPDEIRAHASRLRHSGSLIVGVGLKKTVPSTKCWMYFPEDNCPFYRLTYLSNYSPEVVPDVRTHYSILAEVSWSDHKVEDADCIVDDVIQGLLNTKMITDSDRRHIVDTHVIERDYTYPIPSLERDAALAAVHPFLESRNIFSRGRFGAWRYEVGNMDHSVAQGVEWVNRIVRGDVENELTYQGKRGC
jgi:protoporphyrinogen oxidase